jgi:transposase-like protein
MATTRRHFGADQKAAILKRYLVEKVPLSDLCDEYGIQPNQVYQWQAALFENASAVLERAGRRGRPATVAERRLQHLEEQLRLKEAKSGRVGALHPREARAAFAAGAIACVQSTHPTCSDDSTCPVFSRG